MSIFLNKHFVLNSAAGAGGLGAGGVVIKSANYAITLSDVNKVIAVDSSGGAITITLPTPTAGFLITIKDAYGDSLLNNITVERNGSETIDGVSSDYVIDTNFENRSFISDGTNWFVLN